MARRVKDREERVRYTVLLKRLRNQKELLRRLVADPQVDLSAVHDTTRGPWSYLVSRAVHEGKVRNAKMMRSPPKVDTLSLGHRGSDNAALKKSKASQVLGKVCRGFMARNRLRLQWQWEHKNLNRKLAAALKVQTAWRCALARKIFQIKANNRIQNAAASETSLRTNCTVRVHNTDSVTLRCIRQSDNAQHVVPASKYVVLSASTDVRCDFWRVYTLKTKQLRRVIVLDRESTTYQDVKICSPTSRTDGIIYDAPGRNLEITGITLASINQLLREESNTKSNRRDYKASGRLGIEFTFPTFGQPPCVWVLDSCEIVRWKSWVKDLGSSISLESVLVNLIKHNSHKRARLNESNYDL